MMYASLTQVLALPKVFLINSDINNFEGYHIVKDFFKIE